MTSRFAVRVFRILGILVGGLPTLYHPLCGQVVFYDAGFSTSWGSAAPGIPVCAKGEIPTCANGSSVSGESARFVAGGSSVIFPGLGPLRLEAGLVLMMRGWEHRDPGPIGFYAGLPLLLRIGTWPGRHRFGLALKGGIAPDIGITLFDADLSLHGAVEIQSRSRGGTRFRLSAAFERGLKQAREFHTNTLLITLGMAPRVRP